MGRGGFALAPRFSRLFPRPNPFWRLQRRLWDAEALVLVRAARTADGGFPELLGSNVIYRVWDLGRLLW